MLDVSMFQERINWAEVATAHKVVGIKASEGLYESDPRFTGNRLGASSHRMLVLPYHFANPKTDANANAHHFLNVAHPILRPGMGRPVLDFETTGGLSKAEMISWAKEWFSVIDPIVKCKSILYTYSAFAPNFGRALIDHPLWIANYDGIPAKKVPVGLWPWKMVYIHQYTDKGQCPGIIGEVDLDYRYTTLAKLRIPAPSLLRR